jgi:anti-sigma-K factor RskA
VRLLRHDLHTLTGAYALDAIDGAERERFEHHLHRCPSCDHEVRGLQETGARLALAVARVPPPRLKAAVLTSAAQTRQHPPPVVVRPAAPEPRARWRGRIAVPVAAVASAVAIALGITLGIQHGDLDQARSQQGQLTAVLNAPDARILSERTAVGGTATVVMSRHLGKMIFTTRGLPALPHSRVYQVWLMEPDGGAISAGLLPPASQGRTAPELAQGPAPGDRIGVTVEPAGGTSKPTTAPIVVISSQS